MLKLSGMFHDGAVFQRHTAIPVWGHAAPDAIVHAQFAGVEAMAQAGTDGSFRLYLSAREAGGPYELTVRSNEHSVELRDIHVGEVWLAGGQSNMEFPLEGDEDRPERLYSNPSIRFYRIPHGARVGGTTEAAGRWLPATPENWMKFSAVAFHFARRLQETLGVAVGVIDTSFGGTNIAAWLSEGALGALPFYQKRLAAYHAATGDPADFLRFPDFAERHDRGIRETALIRDTYAAAGTPAFSERSAAAADWHRADFDDSGWALQAVPDVWNSNDCHSAGVFWFRHAVAIPAHWSGRDLMLSLGCIDQQDECFVNGAKVGATGKDWEFSSFDMRRYPVPKQLVTDGKLTIAVRDVCFFRTILDAGLIGPESELAVSCADFPGETVPLAGNWRWAPERLEPAVSGTMLQTCGAGEAHSLHMMFDNMLRPVIPYALQGFLWYQGEADSTELELAQNYQETLCALRADWRRHWGNAELEFLIVQLPGFGRIAAYQPGNYWSLVREAQQLAAQLDGSGVAVQTDNGDPFELHGRHKKVVGERLAALTLKRRNFLEAADPGHGPVAGAVERAGRQLTVTFAGAGTGLVWSSGTAGRSWSIAGADGKVYPAQAVISAPNQVQLSAPEVDAPEQLWYGWSMNPQEANLANAAGYPAGPFRARLRETPFTFETAYLDHPLDPGRVLDCYIPARITQSTAIFMIHGGGWRGGSRAGNVRLLEELAKLGFVAGSTDYRLDAPDAFAQIADIRDSYDRFLSCLKELGRPLKVMFYGESAGAHLALMTGMTLPGETGEPTAYRNFQRVNEWVAPAAIAVQAAPVTFEPWEDIFPPAEQMFRDISGCGYAEDPERRRRLSPIRYVRPATPRVFFLNAANEHMFPLEQTEEFRKRMRQAGRDCRVTLYLHAEHGFLYELTRKIQRQAFDDLADYAANL